jgi:iron(III) transport system ATP-binding protein
MSRQLGRYQTSHLIPADANSDSSESDDSDVLAPDAPIGGEERSLTQRENPVLRIVGLSKSFTREKGEEVRAVDNVTLELERGVMVTVLGPSGCGKTTLLRCIAGLETPTEGEIWNEQRLLSSGQQGIIVPPERRQFGMMFQTYAIWPHMSVYRNVAYPLKMRGWSKGQIVERVENILRVVGIEHLRNEYPAQMSGGQQQRVALARSLVNEPKVILFDEPLSNVDAKVREDLRLEILAMQKNIGFSGVYVTHDQDEAMAISDRIVVMDEGKVLQVGTPREIYRQPSSRFVASFIGVANMWEGQRVPGLQGPTTVVACEIGDVVVASTRSAATDGETDLVVIARPEAFTVTVREPLDLGHTNIWRGTLRTEIFRGDHTEYFVEVRGTVVRARSLREDTTSRGAPEVGAAVFVTVSPDELRVLPRDSAQPSHHRRAVTNPDEASKEVSDIG